MQDYSRLRLLLRICNVSLADLAKANGVSRPLLSAIFAGNHRPRPFLAARLDAAERDLARKARPIVADMAAAVEEVVRHA